MSLNSSHNADAISEAGMVGGGLAAPDPRLADHVVLSLNPMSGATDAAPRVELLAELLTDRGIRAEILTDLDQVQARSAELRSAGRLRALVSAGGDGTVAELVNRTDSGTPICIFPAGNENLLAGYMGTGRSPGSACEAILAAKTRRFDAVRANGRLFLLMIGCGFDAEVCRRVGLWRRGHIRSLDYAQPILSAMRNYEYPLFRVTPEDDPQRAFNARWLFGLNFPRYAGGLDIAPGANPANGLLEVCAFERGGAMACALYAGAVALRQHRHLAGCRSFRVRKLRIESSGDAPFQLDGDYQGQLPVDVEVVPDRFLAVLPAGRG